MFRILLSIRQKMSGIGCCFVRFYTVSVNCTERITLDGMIKIDGRVIRFVHRDDYFCIRLRGLRRK